MSEQALFGGAAATLDEDVDNHADALLDSLFTDDPWEIESDTANPEITPSPAAAPLASSMPSGTAQPPAVNPAGPVRREPFSRSPNAPSTSNRRPFVVAGSGRPVHEPVAVVEELPYSEAKLKGVGLTPLPMPVEPSPLNSARVTPARPAIEWRSRSVAPPPELVSLEWPEQQRLVLERAGWAQAEAARHQDPERKGRLLLTSSELWALAGEPAVALQCVREASQLLPNSALAHRQLRQLSLHAGDTSTALAALEVELNHCTDEMRPHLLGLQAALAAHGNPVVFMGALSDLARCAPRDPRPTLYRLASQLAASAASPELLGSDEPPPGIAAALREAQQYRTPVNADLPAAGDASDLLPPSLAFERARRALKLHKTPALIHALSQLERLEPLQSAARWLSAAVLDGPGNDRVRALDLLRNLQDPVVERQSKRALARSLLELGHDADLAVLLDQKSTAFTPLERACLGVLACDAPMQQQWLVSAASHAQPATLAALRAATNSTLPAASLTGTTQPTSELHSLLVGRTLAREPQLARQLLGATNRNALALLLDLEQARQDGEHARLVQELEAWSQQPGFESLKLTTALLGELHGDPETARRLWQNVQAWDPTSEVAYRATLDLGAESQPLDLETLARNFQHPERIALLLLEAAAQLRSSAPSECLRLLASAVERSPTLPFAYRWASELAREQQDPGILLDWLERRRAAFPEPNAWATTALEAAFAMLDKDRAQAIQLVAEVAAAFPKDLSLQQLGQSLASDAWGDWQPQFARALDSNVEQARLLHDAALQRQYHDLPLALRLSTEAERAHSTPLGVSLHRHWADQTANPEWRETVRVELEKCVDDAGKPELAERLADLAESQDDVVQAKIAWQAVLQLEPDSLFAQRGLEHAQISTHAMSELPATEAALASSLHGREAPAHALLHLILARQVLTLSPEHDAISTPVLERLLAEEPASFAALRTALTRAWQSTDGPRELELILNVLERLGSEEDHAALALRGALLAMREDDFALTETLLDRVLSTVPNHVIALAAQADLYTHLEQWPRVAQALSAFAAASHVAIHQSQALHQAALIWLDRLGDTERGEAALEGAARFAPDDTDIANRLERHYLETEQRVKLLEQIEQRLTISPHGELKQRLVSLRDRTLQEVGATPRPRPVTQKVDASPEHHEALDAYARRSFAGGEIKSAEGAWLQLARIVQEPAKQAEYYRSLAALYCQSDFNLARAAVCYAEVRKRLPNDLATTEKLIDLYQRLQRSEEAIQLQHELLRGARDDAERRRWTLRLASLHEANDANQAELLLQQARKSWPHRAEVLQALAQLYQKSGQAAALQQLLERASKEAKNELLGGSFDLKPFDILRACAEVSHDVDAAHVVRGTQVALGNAQDIVVGRDRLVTGVGAKAAIRRIEALLIPEALQPLRGLLDEAGAALDRATSQDLATLGAAPLEQRDPSLAAHCHELARAFGLQHIDFQVSAQIGTEIVAWASSPPCLVLGQTLVVSGDRPLLTFLLYRALKLLTAQACALVRGNPADAQLRLCALLCSLVPHWQPPGLDRALIQPLSDQISAQLDDGTKARLEPNAQEVLATFGARTAQVSGLLERWAQRTALLATGDISVALRAIGTLAKDSPLPDDSVARLRWIAKTPLARDLVLFSVSDEYFAARRELQSHH